MKKVVLSLGVALTLMLSANDSCYDGIKQYVNNRLPVSMIGIKDIQKYKDYNITKNISYIPSTILISRMENGLDSIPVMVSFWCYKNQKGINGVNMDLIEYSNENKNKEIKKGVLNVIEDISTKITQGEKPLYLFSNPECPHCKEYIDSIVDYASDNNYTLYLVEPTFGNKESYVKSVIFKTFLDSIPLDKRKESLKELYKTVTKDIIGNMNYITSKYMSNKEAREFLYMIDKVGIRKSKKLKENAMLIQLQTQLSKTLGIFGTPMLLDSNGEFIDVSKTIRVKKSAETPITIKKLRERESKKKIEIIDIKKAEKNN